MSMQNWPNEIQVALTNEVASDQTKHSPAWVDRHPWKAVRAVWSWLWKGGWKKTSWTPSTR